MRIRIPENEELFGAGASFFEAFHYIQLWLKVVTRDFPHRFRFEAVDDIQSMEASFIYSIIKNFSSVYILATQNNDYAAIATLIRAIADRIVILKLIYANEDTKEREYRYYLYILDGMKKRLDLLIDKIEYDGKISKAEYSALVKQMQEAKCNTEQIISFCTQRLNQHEYAKINPQFHQSVLKNTNWQYREVGRLGKNGKVAKYKWEDLYLLIDDRKTIISMYSTYFSQFVHGLSLGVLPENDKFENIDALMSVGVCLQGIVMNELKERFNQDSSLLSNVTAADLALITSQLSEDYRNKIRCKVCEE
jgi:hypothetical protein